MADREKVIERIHEAIDRGVCVDLFMDILALLKEQEAKTVIKITKRFNDCDLTGFCPFCSRPLIKDWAEKYCGYCGNPVLWGRR